MENTTKLNLTLDLKDYSSKQSVFKRTASRGIIKRDNLYLFLFGKFGDYKFPGGGVEVGETLEQALIREVEEETGYIVKSNSLQYYGVVRECRKGKIDDVVEMDSHYYFCEVENAVVSRKLDEYEKEYDYQVIWLPIKKAIEQNQKDINLASCPWVIRETKVMKCLLDDLAF